MSIKNMYENTKRSLSNIVRKIDTNIVVGAGVTALLIAAPIGCNRLCNYRTVKNPEYTIVSRPHGVFGHTDYIKHSDGIQELNNYAGVGLRAGRIQSYQDTDGNDSIDIIRVNASEIQVHRMIHFYEAEKMYDSHKEEFDKATKELIEFKEEYLE